MNNFNFVSKSKLISILKLIAIALAVVGGIWLVNQIGIEQIQKTIQQLGIWGFVAIFALRLTSVIIPALPGTAYSVLAGGLFGFLPGLIVICLADLISCSLSFSLSRRYGRNLIAKFLSDNALMRIDKLSRQNLENNFFLMTAFLMTGLFDFVCYGVGLTKIPWHNFLPALLISIALSNPPIVALGAGVLTSGKMLLGFAILGVFILGVITAIVQRKSEKFNINK